ncbi:MAG: glutamine--fructose-6-phosphate transaminase (isomerizing) [Candidatus Ranarchaeia archaeon]
MCGIIGATTTDQHVATVLLEALKRLEYRGYDSVGMATQTNGRLIIKKDAGKIEYVHQRINFLTLQGTTGIGHTRWATHGPPTRQNSHPHTDCTQEIAVVHNGIVENYLSLKQMLQKNGHVFKSDTDTEVIAHLIEYYLQDHNNFLQAFQYALKQIRGYYAVLAINAHKPNTIIAARNGSPLVIGRASKATYAASDIPAFLSLTNEVQYLHDGEVAILTPGHAKIIQLQTGQPVKRNTSRITWTLDQAQKGGYPHFMIKEIHEQPKAIQQTLATPEEPLRKMAQDINDTNRVFAIAAGTSYHACLAGGYMLTHLTRTPVHPVVSSEFKTYMHELVDSETVVLAVSQSGESVDTLDAARHAKKQGAKVYAITNVTGSSLTRIADITFITAAGPEIGVAATKTFTVQLISLARLSLIAAKQRETITQNKYQRYMRALHYTPTIINGLMSTQENKIKRIAQQISNKPSAFFLGRGISTTTALEGALKLKEIAYVHAEGYPAGESKHGPIALVEQGFPVIVIAPPGKSYHHIQGNIHEMKARGASIITVTQDGRTKEELAPLSDHIISIPPPSTSKSAFPELLTPITYITPLQLLAYYAAIARGYDPDFPRNLAKSCVVF